MLWQDVNTALSIVPVNILPLLSDSDFKTIQASVAYNAAGMALKWNFIDDAGNQTQTAVTPSNSGNYLWTALGNGMYGLQIPASAGASINNNANGYGWFSGVATGVLPWRGPMIGFRPAALNNALVENSGVLDTNVTKVGGTTQTARDLGASVLLSPGTGTGQVSLTSGQVIVATNNDKTGYALTAAYDPAKTAAQAGDAMALTSGERTTLAGVIWNTLASALTTASSIGKKLADLVVGTDNRVKVSADTHSVGIQNSTAERNALADALLLRDLGLARGLSAASRYVIEAFEAIRNKWSISGTTITYTKADDTTASWTSTLTGTAGANPVTASDPP